MDPNYIISKKITLLGTHAVGKTSLITRFIEGKFPESYLTTIGLKVDKKTVAVDGYQLDLLIWDIAGHDEPSAFPTYYLKGCQGYLYVVDLSRPETYQGLPDRLGQVAKLLPGVPHLVVGNKLDLLDAKTQGKLQRKIGKQLHGWVSAKTGEGISETFLALGQQLIQRHESL